MGEIANFVRNGAAKVTPKTLESIYRSLPLLKLEFTEIDDPLHPHLPAQLQFLANVIEDFVEGVAEDLPFVALAHAAFALVYARRRFDLIPDHIPGIGRADDSAVVRVVLIQYEKDLASYAESQGIDWQAISTDP